VSDIPIEVLSADSKMFVRNKFKACIGVAISFENPSKFKSAYIQFFEELKKRHSVNSPRYIFKSYDLKMFFSFKKYPGIVENFIECVLDTQTHVNFVFSSFNTQKMPKVQYYVGYKKKQVIEKKTIDLLDSLGSILFIHSRMESRQRGRFEARGCSNRPLRR